MLTHDTPALANTDVSEATTLIELMIRALVDHPEGVKIQVVMGSQAVIYEIEVISEDVKRVIGRKGRTADAIREILTNLGAKAGRRYLLEIVEPKDRPRRPPREPDER